MNHCFIILIVAFSIIPSSQVVSVGEEAVFKCRHPTADLIDWFMNGSVVGFNPPPDVLPGTDQSENGTVVHTLTIVGRPEYNGTVVVCEAFFRDGFQSEHSPEALLVLIEFNTTRPPPGGKITLHKLWCTNYCSSHFLCVLPYY